MTAPLPEVTACQRAEGHGHPPFISPEDAPRVQVWGKIESWHVVTPTMAALVSKRSYCVCSGNDGLGLTFGGQTWLWWCCMRNKSGQGVIEGVEGIQ